MKNLNNTTILLKSLDLELKALLQKDLEQFKASKQKANNQPVAVKQAA